jgi:plasmid stability protein
VIEQVLGRHANYAPARMLHQLAAGDVPHPRLTVSSMEITLILDRHALSREGDIRVEADVSGNLDRVIKRPSAHPEAFEEQAKESFGPRFGATADSRERPGDPFGSGTPPVLFCGPDEFPEARQPRLPPNAPPFPGQQEVADGHEILATDDRSRLAPRSGWGRDWQAEYRHHRQSSQRVADDTTASGRRSRELDREVKQVVEIVAIRQGRSEEGEGGCVAESLPAQEKRLERSAATEDGREIELNPRDSVEGVIDVRASHPRATNAEGRRCR